MQIKYIVIAKVNRTTNTFMTQVKSFPLQIRIQLLINLF